MKNSKIYLSMIIVASMLVVSCKDDKKEEDPTPIAGKTGVLLVTFGSSYGYYDGEDSSGYKYQKPKDTFDNILAIFKDSFPGEDVRMAYTSAIILNKLRKDGKADLDFPNEALETMAQEGFEEITVQSLHIVPGAEYNEMLTLVNDFKQAYPKVTVKVGSPLLDSSPDIKAVAEFLVNHFKSALENNEAVVLMGHGNAAKLSLDQYYQSLQDEITTNYPSYKFHVGTVEGGYGISEIIEALNKESFTDKKVTLAPLMSIAGDHANNDMASSEPDSWKSLLEDAGYTVTPELVGLGAYKDIVDIWVDHKKNAE
jgi:sirohydrochlorin cobaltochelatase